MQDNARAMVLASFMADSLSLGVHWIYDASKIAREYGRVESFLKPKEDSYHPTKDKGEFTHYGDQQLVLLESVAARNGFDLNDFSERWQRFFQDYNGYFDAATKGTLRNFSKGNSPLDSGSPSDDLAGASRIAPLALCYPNDLEELVEKAKLQTRMTHRDPLTVRCAEFFARVAWKSLRGTPPATAVTEVTEETFPGTIIAEWVEEGLQSTTMDSVSAIGSFGQSCHTADAFPGIIHLIAKYESDLREGLIQAVMAGGDNAARGMAVGMILGAYLGEEHLPEPWVTELKKKKEIQHLLSQIG
ncbi:MAG: ADP-ribosylglycohydrolase family protein [Syntrophobacterales bacterium]|jgi:ADP-ribosylglycohydrolase